MEHPFVGFVAKMQDAWNRGDAKGWASAFAPDVDFVNLFGGHHEGQKKIEASHHYLFTGIYENSDHKMTVERIRPVADGIFIALIFAHLKFPEGELDCRMTMLVREDEGEMQIMWFQNTLVTNPAHHRKPEAKAITPNYARSQA